MKKLMVRCITQHASLKYTRGVNLNTRDFLFEVNKEYEVEYYPNTRRFFFVLDGISHSLVPNYIEVLYSCM